MTTLPADRDYCVRCDIVTILLASTLLWRFGYRRRAGGVYYRKYLCRDCKDTGRLT